MSDSSKRRALAGVLLVALLVGLRLFVKDKDEPAPEATLSGTPNTAAPANEFASSTPGQVSAVAANPIKKALKNSSWEIVSRNALTGFNGPSTKLSLEFVRANFDAAGMRGVHQFAAFSPPQYAAIKASLAKRTDTEISAAPDEFATAGETIGFDLNNAEDGKEFSIDLTPQVSADGQSIRLRTITRGTTRRRDGTLPIWDGQTVMIPLGEATGKRNIAAFVTVRLTGADGEPLNEFVVKQ